MQGREIRQREWQEQRLRSGTGQVSSEWPEWTQQEEELGEKKMERWAEVRLLLAFRSGNLHTVK